MAIKFQKTAYPGKIDAFWRKEVRMLPGGFALKQTFPVGEVIQRGAFVYVDMDNMEAAIVKIGVVLEGGNTLSARVSKRNNFCVGDIIMKVGADSTTTVKKVDRSNPDYDVIEVATSISGLVAGDYLQEADSSEKTVKYTANAVLGADLEIRQGGLPTIDASYDAILIKSICPKFPEEWLEEGSYVLKTNHNILVINQ